MAPESPISQALKAATRDIPPDTPPIGGEQSGAAIPPGELKADGYHSGGFVFPEPTTVGYQAIAVLTQKVGTKEDGEVLDMVAANRMALGVAWITWALRHDKNEALLDYALGGDISMAEAAEAMNAEVPGVRFADYMRAASSYLRWVAGAFLTGTGGPEEVLPEAEEPSPSASSS